MLLSWQAVNFAFREKSDLQRMTAAQAPLASRIIFSSLLSEHVSIRLAIIYTQLNIYENVSVLKWSSALFMVGVR